MTDPIICEHPDFCANVAVGRMQDSGRFMADVNIKCAECGTPFTFIGVPYGCSFGEPMASVGGTELRCPIKPAELDDMMAWNESARAAEAVGDE